MTRCLSIVCLSVLSPLVGTAAPDARDLVDLRPGQILVYEGTVTVREATGARPLAEMSQRARLALGIGARPEDRRILVTRTLAPDGSALAPPPFSDVAFFRIGPDLELTHAGELDSDPRLRVLESQLSPQIFPTFPLPAGEALEREISVRGPEASTLKLPARIGVTRSGDRVTLTRSLASGKTGTTELEGQPATVLAWSEETVCDAARKVVVEVRREVTIRGQRGGEPREMSVRFELKEKEIRTLSADETPALAELERQVEGTLADLRARAPPRDIYARILALGKGQTDRLLPGVDEALRGKLSQYRQAMDRTQRAAAASAASPLDKEAHDFTLEDLSGKKVSFREATRGKVALLCFWYSTCPPCKKEAPYLSKLVEKYGEQGLAVVAVNARNESRETIKSFVDSQGLKQQMLLGGQTVAFQYRVVGYPTAFWIDQDGRIVDRVTGFLEEHFPEMEARAETLLLAARAKKAAQQPGK
jgi:thiol-disulfide isomerase/thioredoxin